MAKLLFFAHGEHMKKHAMTLRDSRPELQDMDILTAHAGNVVAMARKCMGRDTEVVLARSACAYALRDSGLPVSVVEVPLGETEFLQSIEEAKRFSPDGLIGILGANEMVTSLKVFSRFVSDNIRVYEMQSPEHALEQIEKARSDGIGVLITGVRFVDEIRAAGLRAVLLGTSVESVSRAFDQAMAILHARALEKRNAKEMHAILNSVSEGIVGFDSSGTPVTVNHFASDVLGKPPGDPAEGSGRALFSGDEQAIIDRVIETGKEEIGCLLKRNGKKYAMRIVPVVVNNAAEGAIATIQEVNALQRIEATIRKGLYQKGNVARYVFDDIKGNSDAIVEAVDAARRFARLRSNILLVGETGTGKELFAQSIHNASDRSAHPFVAVNCGAIPPDLIVSELFGYEDGAFTGAKRGGKMGLFELAHKGTIFLDEISEMDTIGQVNLLRALQERQIRRVGGNSVTPVDVRVIAASNSNLLRMVGARQFRKDLYYRLSVLVIRIPPLCRRAGDISALADFYLRHYGGTVAKELRFTDSALRELESFSWDGNVRQLRNFCEQAAAIATGNRISGAFVRAQLEKNVYFGDPDADGQAPPSPAFPEGESGGALAIKGRIYAVGRLNDLFSQYKGKHELLAKKLGVCRTTLWKIRKQCRAGAWKKAQ